MYKKPLLFIPLLLLFFSSFGQSFSYVNSVICENVNTNPPYNYINEKSVFKEGEPVFAWIQFTNVSVNDMEVQWQWYSTDDPGTPVWVIQDIYPCCGEVISHAYTDALPAGSYSVKFFARTVGNPTFFQQSVRNFTVTPADVSVTISNTKFTQGDWDINNPFLLKEIDESNHLTEFVKVAADGTPCTLININREGSTPYKVFPTADPGGNNPDIYGWFEYKSEDNENIKYLYHSPTSPTQGLNIQVTVQNESTGENALTFNLKVVRPPVLLLHGLKSSASSMVYLRDYLIAAGYSDFPTGYVDAFSYNGALPFTFTYNDVHSFTQTLLNNARNNYQVSAGSVDVVGYSMGGLLARMYLQSGNYTQDINKLITINTPHSGSELSNNPLAAWYAFLTATPAVLELSTHSLSIRVFLNGSSLNAHVTPSHAITSVSDVQCPGSNSNWPEGFLYQICNTLNVVCGFQGLNDCLFDGPNDGVVSYASQRGGLGAGTNISNTLSHSLVRQSSATAARLNTLLSSSSLSTLFSQTGFDPPLINATEAPADRSVLTLKILSPANNTVVAPGQVVHFSVDGSDEVQKVIAGFSGHIPDSIYTLQFTGSDLEFDYTVPSDASGVLRMSVFGTDGGAAYALDTLTLQVQAATAVKEAPLPTGFSNNFALFPNPSSDGFTIACRQKDFSTFTGVLFSAAGKKMFEFESSGRSAIEVDTHQLPRGLYLLRLQHAGSSWNEKWMKL